MPELPLPQLQSLVPGVQEPAPGARVGQAQPKSANRKKPRPSSRPGKGSKPQPSQLQTGTGSARPSLEIGPGQANQPRPAHADLLPGCGIGPDLALPENPTIAGLFEAAVARTPDAVALEYEGVCFSYAQLNARANQLARSLRSVGVGPEIPVGLCVERSLEMVVGLLGILKAGGAYVPLDPDYPAERLLTILESARPPLVLTQQHLRDRLSAVPVPCLELDAGWPRVAREDAANLAPVASPSSLAYIIYTSGSTGTPKGVMNEHRAVCNRLLWGQSEYPINADDRVLQKTPYSFDVSVWEFFWPLLAGARLVLARPGGHREPAYLARLIEEAGITITHFVPSMLGLFLEEPGLELRCRGLKHVFTSGEALPEELASRCLTRIAGARLHNLYGPTEAAVEATYHECRASDPAGPVPIGRPIANVCTYVLDNDGKPVAPGEPGELYLGGVAVARGYWNQPELTAERFVLDPFNPAEGSRMYKTGDLARWLPSGVLEYLGRADFQVKLRGFRIELGEIETALVRLGGGSIRQAVVTAHEARPGEPRLLAYLLGGEAISDEAIREGLALTLPEYMVPSAFVRLTAFPLTTSGKVDRKALPVPALGRDTTSDFVAPRTRLEQTLAQIWQELLGLERVGVHDHFFRLGGQSLTAARLGARLYALGFSIPVRALFERPTIAELAASMAGQLAPEPLQHWSAPAQVPVFTQAVDAFELSGGQAPRLLLQNEQLKPDFIRAQPGHSVGLESAASFAQQRLWFIDRLEGPGLAAYNICTATRLHGPLSVSALHQALVDLVQRHEPLRTSFELRNGQLVQIVRECGFLTLPVDDLRHQIQAERDAAETILVIPSCVKARARAEANRAFDLAAAPLLRARIIKTGVDEQILLLTVHHVAADGWSMDILWRELGAAYHARLAGQAPTFSTLPVRYADYAAWQREQLTGTAFQASLDYWKAQLTGLEDLELPADRARPALLSYEGNRLDFTLSPELVTRLQALCEAAGVTRHMALLAAFQAMLGRLTGRNDLAVGVPTAGRPLPELEGLVGFFVNTLVMRADLSGTPSYRELLERTRQASLDAQEHDAVPFERLVEELQPDRHRNRNPLVQVLFQYLDHATIDFAASGLRATALPDPGLHARFDLEVYVRPAGESLKVEICYATDLFDAETIERFASYFQTWLTGALAAPNVPVTGLALLAEHERQTILQGWAVSEVLPDGFTVTSVVELFAEQARKTPEATAVLAGDVALSYADLEYRSDRLAFDLRGRGLGPDGCVAICAERSVELMVAVLAVLKAGGAYVPLDPGYPADRLQLMVRDAAPLILLTQVHLQGRVSNLGVPTLLLNGELEPDQALQAKLGPDGCVAIRPDSRAYLLYTSGSTGIPKGVELGHRALANLVRWQCAESGLGIGARTLQFSPIGFDVSFQELFSTWCSGGTLVLVTEDQRRDQVALLRLLVEQQVERIFLPFVALRELAETVKLTGITPLHLKEIITAGEQLQITPAFREWLGRQPHCVLVNQYGPTETHVVTHHRLTGSAERWPGLPPIGRPIPGARVYVLDANLQPVPVGVAGELYLGGVAVARGYWNQPELTAERFVLDPFNPAEGSRMYKTGDLARWLPSGVLEYLGRADFQVKLRGFRIELGEIETALVRLGGGSIRQAVVTAHEARPGETRLLAYLLGGDAISETEIREGLARTLPEYMVPSAFVRLTAFPLTTSGKVDRKALPVPDLSPDSGTTFVAPRTRLEQTLAQIWQELLDLERVGVHDHFFRLGGHSLTAVRFVARAAAVGISIPVRSLFERPTIAELAAEMTGQLESEQVHTWPAPALELVPAQAVGEFGLSAGQAPRSLLQTVVSEPGQPVGLESAASFAQQRLWFIDRLEGPGLAAYNICTATRLQGPLSVSALHQALVDLVQRHEPLRTSFELRDGKLVQMIRDCGFLTLPVDDFRPQIQAEREAAETILVIPSCVKARARAEACRPFDLAAAPLLRARIIKTGAEEQILLLTVHHVAADGWSMDILWRELGAAYRARLAGQAPAFPTLPMRYAEYAAWQREQLTGERFENSLAYWKQQLTGLEDLELPADRARPALLSYEGNRLDFTLSPELVTRLQALCEAAGVTRHMALLAAFQAMLGRLTGRNDLAVGVPTAGRPLPELEGLVGFFVNTLVMRADLSGTPSYRELLERTRQASLDAQEHDAVPFERLVEELQPDRHRNRNPLVQVVFQYLDAMDWEPLAPDLRAAPFVAPTARVRFDLELHMQPLGTGLAGAFYYSTDLFDRPTIERFARRLERFLTAALMEPNQPLAAVSLVGPDEHALLDQWNATEVDYPATSTVHGLFSQQAARMPEAKALVFGATSLSYGELDRLSSGLAARLRLLGAGPGTVIALGLPRSWQQVMTLLGILKSGAAYLPLDPANPAERNATILAEARATALVTNAETYAKLPATGLPTLLLDDWDADSETAFSVEPVSAETSSWELAYVMYTSGSTGVPKGVMVEHRSIARLVFGQSYASFGPDRVVLQLAPVAFDASTFEIWGALLHGGTLVIAPEGLMDLTEMGELIADQQVTTLWLTAGLFNEIVDSRPETLRGVQEILTGGEVLSLRHVQRAQERLGPATQIINGYGPTECTTFACCHAIPREDQAVAGTIPIGRPIGNTRAYVLDAAGDRAPIGVAGSLCLGGPGVARGYWNQPELTAERFLADRFSPDPGARMYVTGDQARWLADGTLEFLGRQDGQVKLRGFRIELGEIEAALERHPGVARCAVTMQAGRDGYNQLVAYWCPAESVLLANGPQVLDLAGHLKGLLPGYMVPARFIRLDRLPLSLNGKIDRQALPALPAPDGQIGLHALDGHVPPRNRLEAVLARLWAKHLGVAEPGVRDNFFELGGHSLLAIGLLVSIEHELGQRISIATLFDHPTIERLAGALGGEERRPARAVVTPLIEGDPHAGPTLVMLPSVFGELGQMTLLSSLLPRSLRAVGIRVEGDEPYWDGCHTAEDIARGFIDALRAAEVKGPYLLVGYSFAGRMAFEMAQQLVELGEQVIQVVIVDTTMEVGPRNLREFVLQDLPSIVTNLGAKFQDEFLPEPQEFVAGLGRRLRDRSHKLTKWTHTKRPNIQRVSSRVPSSLDLRLGDSALDRLKLPQIYQRRLEASLAAFRNYQPAVYPGDLTVLACRVQATIHRAQPMYGWARFTTGKVRLKRLPGHHHNLFKMPHIHGLATTLVELLDEIQGEPERPA